MHEVEPDNASVVSLIYEDTKRSLLMIRDDVRTLNVKLGVLFGVSASLAIGSAKDLPDQTVFSLPLKIFVPVCLAGSVVLSLVGSLSRSTSVFVKPKSQLAKADASEAEFMKAVINVYDDMIGCFVDLAAKKAKVFNWSLICLGMAAWLTIAGIVASSVFR